MKKYSAWVYIQHDEQVDYDEVCVFDKKEDAEAFVAEAQAYSDKHDGGEWDVREHEPLRQNMTWKEYLEDINREREKGREELKREFPGNDELIDALAGPI